MLSPHILYALRYKIKSLAEKVLMQTLIGQHDHLVLKDYEIFETGFASKDGAIELIMNFNQPKVMIFGKEELLYVGKFHVCNFGETKEHEEILLTVNGKPVKLSENGEYAAIVNKTLVTKPLLYDDEFFNFGKENLPIMFRALQMIQIFRMVEDFDDQYDNFGCGISEIEKKMNGESSALRVVDNKDQKSGDESQMDKALPKPEDHKSSCESFQQLESYKQNDDLQQLSHDDEKKLEKPENENDVFIEA